jgi:hypothetical protein
MHEHKIELNHCLETNGSDFLNIRAAAKIEEKSH